MRRLAILLALTVARPAPAQPGAPAPGDRCEALLSDARRGPAGMARAALAIAREPALAECAKASMPRAWANPPEPVGWAIFGAVLGAGAENAEVAEAALPSLDDPDPLVRATAGILCSCAVSSAGRCTFELRRLGLGMPPRYAMPSGSPPRELSDRVGAAVLALRSEGDGLDAKLLACAQGMLAPPDVAAMLSAGSWTLALDAMSLLPAPDAAAVTTLVTGRLPSREAEAAVVHWLQVHASADVLADALGQGAGEGGLIARALLAQPDGVAVLATTAARGPQKRATAALAILRRAPDEDLAKAVTHLLAAARRPGLGASAAVPLARALATASPADAVTLAPDGPARAEVLRQLALDESITAAGVRVGLRSADRDVRHAALEAAQHVSAEDAASLLPDLLAFIRVPRTEDGIRGWRHAPGALEDMRPPEPCPPEPQRLDDLVLDALVFHAQALPDAIVAALERGTPHERAAAAWVVRELQLELTPAPIAALVRNARHRDVAVRAAALAALEDAPDDAAGAWTAVAEGMVDPSPVVRWVARAVSVRDAVPVALDGRTIAALVAALDDSDGSDVGLEAALRAAGAASVPALAAATSAPAPRGRKAARLLAEMSGGWLGMRVDEAESAARRLLQGDDPVARRAMATAVARLPAFRDLVAPAASDPDPELRAAAILADPPRSADAALGLALRLVREDVALRRVAMELLRSASSETLSSAQLDAACAVTLGLLPDDEGMRYDTLWALSRFECAWPPEDAASIAGHLTRMPAGALTACRLPSSVVGAAVAHARAQRDGWPLVALLAGKHAEAKHAIRDAVRSKGLERAAALDALAHAVRVALVRDEEIVAACESVAWSADTPRAQRDEAMEVLLASGSAPRLERVATSGPERFRRRAIGALLSVEPQRGVRILLDRAIHGTPRDRAGARAQLRHVASRDDLRAALAPTPEEDVLLDDALRCP